MSPVDQAKEAAEERTNQGEDDEFSEEFEYEHPPWTWRGLFVSLEVLPVSLEGTPWILGGNSLSP